MKRMLTATLLGLTAFAANAADEDKRGWNAGASAVFGDYSWDNDVVDDSSTGLKLFGGYRFGRWLGVEGTYWNFGDFKGDVDPLDPGGDVEAEVDGFSGTGLLYLPFFGDSTDAFLKAGYYDFDQQLVGSDTVIDENSPDGLTAGAGIRALISRNLAFRADYDWFDVDDADLWAISVGVEYLFGRPEPVAAVVPAAAAAVAAAPPPPPPPPPPPSDTDGDGVVDASDQCPDTPKGDRVGAQGCSCDVTRQLKFAFGSADLTAEDKAVLDEVVTTLERLKFVAGVVEGHTDSVGSDEFNQALSERRARTVANYLEDKGIGAGRLNVEGFGESKPIGDNATAEGRAENRRVVLRRTDCDVSN